MLGIVKDKFKMTLDEHIMSGIVNSRTVVV